MTANVKREGEQFCGECQSWNRALGHMAGHDVGVCIEDRCLDYGHVTTGWHPCPCEVVGGEIDEEVAPTEVGAGGNELEETLDYEEPLHTVRYAICDYIREHVATEGLTIEDELIASGLRDWQMCSPDSYKAYHETAEPQVRVDLEGAGSFEVTFTK